MNGHKQSDPAIVAAKSPNKSALAEAEAMEPRAGAKENAGGQNTLRTLSRDRVTHELARVRERARQKKKEKFTALLQHINPDSLTLAFYALKRKAAAGVDGMTWQDYEQNLDARIEDLHGRVHRGAYRPQPARRTYIPKADGSQRPLAIAALEDKIVQGAAVMMLNAIYEEDFLGFSYGFRPGRGAHDAMDALVMGIASRKVNFILDADIRSFFDSVNQEWLIRFLEHRIGDKRVIRLIQKWLKAGVLEDGIVSTSDRGTGQGSAISPLLANIYLHYVFDLWAERYRRREAKGDMIIVRYADDVTVGFEREEEASRFLDALKTRFAEFALALHPDKTRIVEFGRFAAERRKQRGLGKPETFNFLGFTFICGKSRDGRFLVKRKSRHDRMRAKLQEIKKELRRCMHAGIADHGRWLRQVVTGYFNYHAVPTNYHSLEAFHHHILEIWRRVLKRRSQKDHTTWDVMTRLGDQWLPKPRILHPWPTQRFVANHPRREPYAGKPLVRFCAGGA
jgi:group II intron reverse transcriptase/maturase